MSQAQAGARPSKTVDIAQVSVPRLVFALLHQRFTGVLQLAQPGHGGAARSVWFSGGMPVFTDWQEPTDMLGQILIAGGLLVDTDLYPALAQADAAGQRLGQVLVSQGRLSPEQLSECLRKQCSRKVSHLFALREGHAEVIAEAHEVGSGDGLIKLNVLELIHASVGVYYDEARVEAEMGAAMTSGVRATAALQKYAAHFHFRPADADILEKIAAGTDLEKLSALPGVTRRRAAQLIYTLWACQMLHIGAAADARAAPPAAARPRATTTPGVGPAAAAAASQPPAATAPAPAAAMAASPTPAETREDESVPPARARAGTQPEVSSPRRPRSQTAIDVGSSESGASERASPPSPSDSELESELARFEGMLAENAHAFRLFDVPLDATKKQVRHAWGDLSRKFHPDALASRGLDHLRERVSTVFAALSEAHHVLGDASAREKLREQVESGDYGKPQSDETARVRAAFESELLAKEGDKLLRANRFDRALERYREATELHGDEPDIQAAIVWCEFQLSAKSSADHSRANARLGDILHEAPNIARAYYFRGFVLAGLGHDPLAIEAFSRAQALDPRLIDAERQARAIRMRRASPAPSSKGRGLRGFFGGKK
jgi:hypothetical protein